MIYKNTRAAGITTLILGLICLQGCFSVDEPYDCENGDSPEGVVCISFADEDYHFTKASFDVPDTNDFILTVKSGEKVIYEGPYGAAPEKISVPAGSVQVSAVSTAEKMPMFDCPVFGDEKYVIVPANGTMKLRLECRQTNCGVKLNIGSDFLTQYPGSAFLLKSGAKGLLYAYNETRTAYFDTGEVALVMTRDGMSDITVMSRKLEERQILSINVCVSSPASLSAPAEENQLSMGLDTTTVRLEETVCPGIAEKGKGSDKSTAYSVTEAKKSVGGKGVWVYGYIVGGDLTNSTTGMKTQAPFSSSSNLAVATKSSTVSKASCLSVQLPSGAVREALNLVSTPDNLHKAVFLKGDIVQSYFGIVGIKNVKEWEIR